MPTDNKDTGGPDLRALLEGLTTAGVEFILVGGLAAVIQGAPVTTMDADIVYRRTPENVGKLLAFLRSTGAIYRRPDNRIIEPMEDDFSGMGHALFTTDLGPLDVLAFIEEGNTFEDLIGLTADIKFRGREIHVLDLKSMIELKRTSKDPVDKQRLPVLEETLRQQEEE